MARLLADIYFLFVNDTERWYLELGQMQRLRLSMPLVSRCGDLGMGHRWLRVDLSHLED